MRKKNLSGLAILGTLTLLTLSFAFAGKNGPAGRSNIGHLYLYEKDASWQIVPGGAWGKMKYNLAGSTFDFVFNGHGLESGEGYKLIYYPDGGIAGALIYSGTANTLGDIHLGGSVDLGMDLPDPADSNFPKAKIWLVLSNHWSNGWMTDWEPGRYLFEGDLISYDDTDA